MITDLNYALMAGRAYQTSLNPSGINFFPVPTGWTEFFQYKGVGSLCSHHSCSVCSIEVCGLWDVDVVCSVRAFANLGDRYRTVMVSSQVFRAAWALVALNLSPSFV